MQAHFSQLSHNGTEWIPNYSVTEEIIYDEDYDDVYGRAAFN